MKHDALLCQSHPSIDGSASFQDFLCYILHLDHWSKSNMQWAIDTHGNLSTYRNPLNSRVGHDVPLSLIHI